MDISTLLYFLKLSDFVVNKNCEGITHEDSLLHPQGGAHCINWVIGHIVKTRNEVSGLLGKEPLYPASNFAAYTPDDFTPQKAVPFEELKRSFHELQKSMEVEISSLTPERMLHPASFSPTRNPDETVGSLLGTILWHEAYHAGQLGIVRREIGKIGVIKNPEGK
ncbi:MAG: DinB family protein [Acidobacteriota bacterium]